MTSNCEYRSWLCRHFTTEKENTNPAIFCMLNPSTADQSKDDPTIRRCISFALREKRTSLYVVNLFNKRATNPKDLWASPEETWRNEDGCSALCDAMDFAKMTKSPIVCAWGAHHKARDAADAFFIDCQNNGVEMVCLGKTQSGAPRHPLYVKSDQPIMRWENVPF